MAAIARMRAVVLDCPDPRALAAFYRHLVGGEITYADEEWVDLRDGEQVMLSFQLAPDYRPPEWPSGEQGQQIHLDVTVDDVDGAEEQNLMTDCRVTPRLASPVPGGDHPRREVDIDPTLLLAGRRASPRSRDAFTSRPSSNARSKASAFVDQHPLRP